MSDNEDLREMVQNLTAQVSTLSGQLSAVERDRAYRASLPKDDDVVLAQSGKGLFARDVWMEFGSIKNCSGLRHDAATNVWHVDQFPDYGFGSRRD